MKRTPETDAVAERFGCLSRCAIDEGRSLVRRRRSMPPAGGGVPLCSAATCSWAYRLFSTRARFACAAPLEPMSTILLFLPFALPCIGDDEIAEVVDTLRSGWLAYSILARRMVDAMSARGRA